jgi:hypothetical protein
MTKSQSERLRRLMPNGIPKYVRVYDNQGETVDRYSVIFTGRYEKGTPKDGRWFSYLAMSGSPFHPQGVGISGSTQHQPADTIDPVKGGWHWPPAIGRRNHLGKRIRFEDLPEDCRKLTIQDYIELWGLNEDG